MNVNNKPRNRREKNKNTKPNQHTPGRGPKAAESSGQSWKNLCSEAWQVMEKQAGLGTDQAWQKYPAALKLSDSHWSYCSHPFVCLCHLLSPILECR